MDEIRVLTLITAAARHVHAGRTPVTAAVLLLKDHHPTQPELHAARQTNLDLHSGGGEHRGRRYRDALPAAPVGTPLVRFRRQIDDVLVAVHTLTT